MKTATDFIGIQRQLPVWGAIAAIPPKAGQRAWKRGGATLLALVVSGAGLWWLMSTPWSRHSRQRCNARGYGT